MTDVLIDLTEHRTLTRENARRALIDLATGGFNPAQASAFLTSYMMRTISISELQGFRDAMLELCIPVSFYQPVMDVCGTGGDGKKTFNISTTTAFVVAAAGQAVAKHGNYGVSSISGSSNVLEYLGCRFLDDPLELTRCLDETNICFMHAPTFHPAMKNVASIRKELGIRTFFNMLGPMVNPARPHRQMIGVFGLELARQYGYLYQDTGVYFSVFHDAGGYDEITLTGPVKVFSSSGEMMLTPQDFGLEMTRPQDLLGGSTIEDAAAIFLRILEGRGTPAQQRVVVANAALALQTAGHAHALPACVALATEALESGNALTTFKRFQHFTS